jgi:hypothetical protein
LQTNESIPTGILVPAVCLEQNCIVVIKKDEAVFSEIFALLHDLYGEFDIEKCFFEVS